MARHIWVDGDIANASRLNAFPGGVVGYALGATSDQTGISATTDVTGLTATWTAEVSRLYRVTAIINVVQVTSAATVSIILADGSNTQINGFSARLAATDFGILTVVWLDGGMSGSLTRKVRVTTGAGTVTVKGSSTLRGSLVVEDLGLT